MNVVDNNAPRNRANSLDVVNAPEQSINVCNLTGFINPVWLIKVISFSLALVFSKLR